MNVETNPDEVTPDATPTETEHETGPVEAPEVEVTEAAPGQPVDPPAEVQEDEED